MLPVRSEYTYKIKLKNKPPPFFKTGKPVAEPEPPPAVPEPCALPAANKKPVSKRRAFQAGGRTRTAAGSTGAVPLPAENKKPVSKRRAFQAGGRTRTDDLRITNALLYQLSHTSIFGFPREYLHIISNITRIVKPFQRKKLSAKKYQKGIVFFRKICYTIMENERTPLRLFKYTERCIRKECGSPKIPEPQQKLWLEEKKA